MSTKHYVKNIAGAKFYPEGYNGWGNDDYSEYRLLAKSGEYYYLFLDIPFIVFPLKVIPYKRVLTKENVWTYNEVVLPSKRELITADDLKNSRHLKVIGDKVVTKCFVDIIFSDGTSERQYFDTDRIGLACMEGLKKNYGLYDVEWILNGYKN